LAWAQRGDEVGPGEPPTANGCRLHNQVKQKTQPCFTAPLSPTVDNWAYATEWNQIAGMLGEGGRVTLNM